MKTIHTIDPVTSAKVLSLFDRAAALYAAHWDELKEIEKLLGQAIPDQDGEDFEVAPEMSEWAAVIDDPDSVLTYGGAIFSIEDLNAAFGKELKFTA